MLGLLIFLLWLESGGGPGGITVGGGTLLKRPPFPVPVVPA